MSRLKREEARTGRERVWKLRLRVGHSPTKLKNQHESTNRGWGENSKKSFRSSVLVVIPRWNSGPEGFLFCGEGGWNQKRVQKGPILILIPRRNEL